MYDDLLEVLHQVSSKLTDKINTTHVVELLPKLMKAVLFTRSEHTDMCFQYIL